MIRDFLTTNELQEYLPYLTVQERGELDKLLNDLSFHVVPEFTFRGAAKKLQELDAREIVIAGPSETGKTIAALKLVDTLCRTHPKLSGAIVRKVRADMNGTILKVFKRAFVDVAGDIEVYGGESVEFYQYANGSRLWVGGMDRPGKVLSGELDLAYVNQAEELSLDDWEILSTRTTGRAGVLVPGKLLGDANPGPPTHWILARAQEGKLVKLESRHEDNPRLYDDAGNLTDAGIETMRTLDNLTGVRKERLRYGRWVQAEGVVYEEFDPNLHVIDTMPQGWEAWRKIRSVDFGFTNPFSCSWWAIDGDGRMYQYRQIYMTQRTVKVHSQDIKRVSQGEAYEANVADHDAEDRATLQENEINTVAAKKEISVGIDRVKERMKIAGDGKPRIFFLKSALVERDESLAEKHLPLCTTDELLMYSYPKAADGKPIKETPVDMFNHGCDEMRYAVMQVDAGMTGQLFY